MKRICIVTRNMMSGGAERVIQQLIQYMQINGYQVELILIYDKPIQYKIHPDCKVSVIRISKSLKVFDKLQRYAVVRKLVKKGNFDIVLSMPEEIGIYVLLALLGLNIPVVVSERNDPRRMPQKNISRFLRQVAYPFASGFVFQTQMAASFFSKKIQSKGIVLPNPLDTERLKAPFEGRREKVIVGAGRLEDQKNFPLLINAFVRFHTTHQDYRLVIYGEGSQHEKLIALVRENGLDERTVELAGRTDDLIGKMQKAAMFVLSSDFEGMPNVLIEAMAMGIPSISTDCPAGGSAELIDNYQNGILVPVNDAGAICQAMTKIADDEKFANAIGQHAVELRGRLNAERICEEWIDYLLKVKRLYADK